MLKNLLSLMKVSFEVYLTSPLPHNFRINTKICFQDFLLSIFLEIRVCLTNRIYEMHIFILISISIKNFSKNKNCRKCLHQYKCFMVSIILL